MRCLICGKELDGEIQICSECFAEMLEKDPLWYCRDFSVGESIPDILARNSVLVLSLGKEEEKLIDGKSIKEALNLPDEPMFDDASSVFWKINMFMQHMGIGAFLEDAEYFEPTYEDIGNLSFMLRIADRMQGFENAAEEETLCRLASVYYFGYISMEYLRGVSPDDMEKGRKSLYSRISAYIRSAEKIKPSRGIAEINRGFLDLQIHRYKDAINHFRRVPDLEKNPRALTDMGRAYEGMEMFESADEYYTKALRIDEEWPDAWEGKASAALSMKRWGAALQFISRAISLRPDIARTHILQGDIFLRQGLYEEADRAYTSALRLKNGEKAWIKRAEALYAVGRWGAALQFVERYLLVFPQDPDGWRWKGKLLKETGEIEKAKEAYEKALSLRDSADVREEMMSLTKHS